MKQRQKRNVAIGILCCMLVFMGVGYAALQQVLTISGTGNITGNWKIEITSISPKEINEGEHVSEVIEDSKVAGSFVANLKKPTDAVEYTVTVENKGTIDAVLESITPEDYSNGDIKYTTGGKEECKYLNAGASCNFTIKVEYLDTGVGQTPILKGTEVSQTFTILYVQKTSNFDTMGQPGGDILIPTDEPAITVDSNGKVIGFNKQKLTNSEGYVVIPATTAAGEKIVSVDRGSFLDYNVKMAYVYNETTDEEIEAYVIYDEENYEEIKSILSSEMEDEGSGSGSYSSNSYVLHKDINPTNLTTKHNKKITLEKLSGSGSGSSEPPKIYSKTEFEALLKEISSTGEIQTEYEYMYVNMETGEFYEELVSSIEKLDLTEATNLKTIGEYAFAWSPLKEIKFSDSIETIEANAFYESQLSGTLTIPESVKSIYGYAFYGNQINKVVLPSNLEILGTTEKEDDSVFASNQIIEIVFAEDSKFTLLVPGLFANNQIRKVQIPETVTIIGNYVFENNQISELILSENLEEIGDSAFSDNNIKEINFSKNSKLKTIGPNAFSNNQISDLMIPSWIAELGSDYSYYYGAFRNNPIKTLNIAMETIPNYAFYNSSIQNLSLGSNVKEIGKEAFRNNQIEDLVIPESVTEIGTSAFKNNAFSKRESIEIKYNDNNLDTRFDSNWESIGFPTWVSIGCFGISEIDSSKIVNYSNSDICSKDVVIPTEINGTIIRTLGESLFVGMNLKSVTISDAITKIEAYAFSDVGEIDFSIVNSGLVENPTMYSMDINYQAFGSSVFFNTLYIDMQIIPVYLGNAISRGRGIQNLIIGSNVETISGYNAMGSAGSFKNTRISSLSFEENSKLKTISPYAFYGATLPSNIILPASVTEIGGSAFSNTYGLSTITVKRSDSNGMTLGSSWNGNAQVVYNPNYIG